MRNILLIIITLLVFISCRSDNKNRKRAEDTFSGFKEIIKNPDSIPEINISRNISQTIEIPSDIDKTVLNIDRIIDSAYYVRLETNNDCLIGSINKILFFDDKILTIENLQRTSVLMFTDKGTFIRKIGMEGRGPGEYVSIGDVAIDYKKERIIFLDGFGRKLLFYDFDGNFIESKRLFYFPSALSVLMDESYLFTQFRSINLHIPSVTEYNLLFAKSDQSITGKAISYTYRDKYKSLSMGSLHSFNSSKNGVVYCPPFANEIYRINENNNVSAKYTLIIGPKDVNRAMGSSTTNDDFINLINTNNFYHFEGPAFETDNFLYFYINRGGDCYYSKKTKKLFYGNHYRFRPDSTKVLTYSRPVTVRENYFVSVILPNGLVNSLKYHKPNKYLQRVVEDLQEEDNPILFFYSLKDL